MSFKSQVYRLARPLAKLRHVETRYHDLVRRGSDVVAQESLQNLLAFAAQENDYYGPLLKTALNLHDLPILTKAIMQDNFDKLVSHNPPAPTYKNSSGGSTGKPQTFIQDKDYASWSEVTQEYYFREFLHCDYLAVKKVVLWGSERDTFKQSDPVGHFYNWATNTLFFNTFRVTDAQWQHIADVINREKPHFIKGYAGSLYEMARFAKQYKIKMHQSAFVYSAAETLQAFMREEIEAVFGAKVYDFYGSREVGPMAGECKAGQRHIFTFNNHLEIVDAKNQPVKNGIVGKIIVTNLHNYAMPLLRYEIGDMGSLGSSPCACGSKLPYFAELKGRVTDHFVTKTGELIHGEYFTHLFYFHDWIESFQVNQLEEEKVEVLVVKNDSADQSTVDATAADITGKIKFVMGQTCKVDWKFVADIPKTAQGKHLFTRSLVKR